MSCSEDLRQDVNEANKKKKRKQKTFQIQPLFCSTLISSSDSRRLNLLYFTLGFHSTLRKLQRVVSDTGFNKAEISLFLERLLFQTVNQEFQQALVNRNYTEEWENAAFCIEFSLLLYN